MGEVKGLSITNRITNQSGQFLIETVLLMLITVGFFLFLMNQLKQMDFVKKLVEDPWGQVAGMIESGSWESPQKARRLHPNQTERGVSFDPQSP